MRISVKSWSKFQHFKDRRPPWIKLYRDILDDIEWHKLDPAAAKTLVMIWLIASEDEGSLPNVEQLAFRLRLTVGEVLTHVKNLSHWLNIDDDKTISSRYQQDTLADTESSVAVQKNSVADVSDHQEREAEEETEREGEKEKTRRRATYPCPDDVEPQTWADWLALRKAKKAPVTETVVNGAIREAGKAGMGLEAFLSIWCTRGSQGLQADWLRPSERSAGAFATMESFRERDERLARQKYAEMVGRPVAGEIIDVTPNNLGIEDASDQSH